VRIQTTTHSLIRDNNTTTVASRIGNTLSLLDTPPSGPSTQHRHLIEPYETMENKTKAFTSRDLVSSSLGRFLNPCRHTTTDGSLDLNSSPSKSQGRLAEREGFHLAFREAIIDNLGSNGQFQPFSDLLERSENSLSQASAKDILLFLEIVLVYATPRFYSTINTSDTLDRVFSKWFSKIKSNEAYRGILPPLLLVCSRLVFSNTLLI
jgi:hypothetical protein